MQSVVYHQWVTELLSTGGRRLCWHNNTTQATGGRGHGSIRWAHFLGFCKSNIRVESDWHTTSCCCFLSLCIRAEFGFDWLALIFHLYHSHFLPSPTLSVCRCPSPGICHHSISLLAPSSQHYIGRPLHLLYGQLQLQTVYRLFIFLLYQRAKQLVQYYVQICQSVLFISVVIYSELHFVYSMRMTWAWQIRCTHLWE